MFGLSWPVLIAAVVVAVLGTGRLTRLIVADAFPPVLWVKAKWDTWTEKTPRRQAYWLLLNCPWCASPYIMGACLGWVVSDVYLDGQIDWPWWVFWGWLSLSYLSAIVVYHDEGKNAE